MKQLTLVVHTDVEQQLIDHLRSAEGVSGYTITTVEGHGARPQSDAFLAARDQVVGHEPRLRIDVLLKSEDLQILLSSLAENHAVAGECAYWITAVEQAGHV